MTVSYGQNATTVELERMGNNKEAIMGQDTKAVVRVIDDVNGYKLSDDRLDYLDTRGPGLKPAVIDV